MKFKLLSRFTACFVFLFILLASLSCDHFKGNYRLDTKKYTDVTMVYLDVYIVNDKGLFYLELNGKKISKDYRYISSLNSNHEFNFNYFLGKTLDGSYTILDMNGKEITFNHKIKYENISKLKDGIVFINDEEKYVYASFIKDKEVLVYDHILPVYTTDSSLFDRMIARNDISDTESEFFLLDDEGRELISNSQEISYLFLMEPNTTNRINFFSVKDGDLYRLANANGEYIGEYFDNITKGNNFIKCEKSIKYTINNEIHDAEKLTFVNYQNQIITYYTLNSLLERFQSSFSNNYFVTYKNIKNNKVTLETFEGNKYLFNTLQSYIRYSIFTTDEKVGFIDERGNLLHEEDYSVDNHPVMIYNNVISMIPNYLFYSNNKEMLYVISAEHTKELSIDPVSYIDYHFNLISNGVYSVSKRITNNKSKYSFFSVNYTQVNDVSELTYYDDIKYYNFNGISYAIAIDYEAGICKLIETGSGKEFTIGKHINSENISNLFILQPQRINANVDIYSFHNTINGFVLRLYYLFNNQPTNEYYIFYKNEIFINGNEGELEMFNIEDNIWPSHSIGENYIYLRKNATTDIYSFQKKDDKYKLEYIDTLDYNIRNAILDLSTNKEYFVFQEFNRFGLCDVQGNVILYPQFNDIIDMENNNLIVSNKNKFGVIKLLGNNKYKLLLNTVNKNIDFIGDGNFTAVDQTFSMYFYDNNGRQEKNEIIGIDYLVYSSAGPKRIHAQKLNFGDYVRIYYSKDEIVLTYSVRII